MLRRINEKILDILFPQNKEEEMVRDGGKEAFARRIKKDFDHKDFIYLFEYKDPFIREAVWLLKYRRNKWLAEIFAFFIYEILLEELGDRMIFDDFVNPLLIPIPLSKKRFNERGFNQTELIAKELIKKDLENYLELETKALIKIKETESQTRKTKKGREENVRNSFSVAKDIKERNIILLDDVLTTGSTIHEAERVLIESGAKNILKIVVAS